MVRQEVIAKAGLTDADIDRGGLKIVSTFDRKTQADAVKAMKDELPTDGAKGVGAGLVSIKPGDGAVVAMYGGKDAVKKELNDATQSVMQAGSTFKPFALAAALEDGISLKSRYDGSSPKKFGTYEVSNYGSGRGEQFGNIDLITATAHSVNTVYVALNHDVGPEKTMQAAIKAGYPADTLGLKPPQLGNVLGTASPHVIDVAEAYATFAAQGIHADPYTVLRVSGANGKSLYKAKPKTERVFSADSMADLTYALQAVIKNGTGSYAGSRIDRPLAGKTGTAQNNNSAWFAGYTPQLATAVGLYRNGTNDKGQVVQLSLNGLGGNSAVTGASFPLKIWTAFMKDALDGQKVLQFPTPRIRRQEQRADVHADADDEHTHDEHTDHQYADDEHADHAADVQHDDDVESHDHARPSRPARSRRPARRPAAPRRPARLVPREPRRRLPAARRRSPGPPQPEPLRHPRGDVRHDRRVTSSPGADEPVVAPSRDDPSSRASPRWSVARPARRVRAGRHGWWTAARVLVVLSMVVLALGVVQKQHCRAEGWSTPDQFFHACYSDLPLVYETSGLATGAVPYVDSADGRLPRATGAHGPGDVGGRAGRRRTRRPSSATAGTSTCRRQ